MNIDKFRSFIKYYTSFFFYLAVLLGVLLFIFYPRTASSSLGIRREQVWTGYEKKLSNEKNINPQEYWQFREFYNEGNFDFKKNGFSPNTIQKKLDAMAVPLDASTIESFLLYSSPHLNSIDALVTAADLKELIDPEDIKLVQKIKTGSFALLENNEKKLLIFVLPVSEMQKANGFFKYDNKKSQEELKDKYWLNITEIQT